MKDTDRPHPFQVKLENVSLVVKDWIATLTFRTKGRPMNVITPQVIRDMSRALTTVEERGGVKVLLIFADGEHFTPGADISAMVRMGPEKAREFSRLGQDLTNQIEDLTVPVIISMHGYCLGGGLEIALACDIRIASENAVFSQPEMNIGVLPGWGGSQRLPRLVGLSKAKELIYTGRKIDATEALDIGLVDLVVPEKMLRPAASGIAENIVEKPRVALATAKCAINSLFDLPMSRGMEVERRLWSEIFATADKEEGMKAFLEKRRPIFTDRLDEFASIKSYIKAVCSEEDAEKRTIYDIASAFERGYRSALQNYMEYVLNLQSLGREMAFRNVEFARHLLFSGNCRGLPERRDADAG